jgi:lipoteichoic acid synthase
MMNAAGYETLTFHGNTVHFWNRKQLYGALGFTKYFDAEFFRNSDALAMGPSDEALFRDSMPELVRRDKEGTRFLAEFITLSSHRPFDAIPPDRQGITVPAEARGTLPGNYVIAQNYADKAIGQFLDELDKSGLADKSIVVVYGDHWGLADDANQDAQKALFGREVNELDLLNVPLIIHMPGQTTGTVVPEAAGQVDIAPTLVGALGLDES